MKKSFIASGRGIMIVNDSYGVVLDIAVDDTER